MTGHTVEKIGGTSMSRSDELIDTLLINGHDETSLYNRIFVVSAYGGITNLLLEDKKTGEPGVYGLFANSEETHGWSRALDEVAEAMFGHNERLLHDPADRRMADDFVRERVEGARNCLIDLQRLCSYGHFQLEKHMMTIRELVSGLGEAHSAHNTALLLRRHGVNARFVDLTGWRDESQPSLDERLDRAFADIDLSRELPIVTGYAQCKEGLMAEFDRGYSEVTFAQLAARTGAREAVIHKEFHLSSADPKTVGAEAVRKIGRTNYDVADQLSNLGMEAIHPSAAKTLRQAGIPLRVANAFEPHDGGTLIVDEIGGEESRVEMITGLHVLALEVLEQDMVGVKGYDATILQALTRHDVWIVSKTSNANTIVHYCKGSLKGVRRVERDVAAAYPSAQIRVQKVSLVSAIGCTMRGLKVVRRGLQALEDAGVDTIAVQENGRAVDVQFVVPEQDLVAATRALHAALVESQAPAGEDTDKTLRSAA